MLDQYFFWRVAAYLQKPGHTLINCSTQLSRNSSDSSEPMCGNKFWKDPAALEIVYQRVPTIVQAAAIMRNYVL